jgi:hypothetical protein
MGSFPNSGRQNGAQKQPNRYEATLVPGLWRDWEGRFLGGYRVAHWPDGPPLNGTTPSLGFFFPAPRRAILGPLSFAPDWRRQVL